MAEKNFDLAAALSALPDWEPPMEPPDEEESVEDEKLRGFLQIDSDLWNNIVPMTKIRYTTHHGKLKSGFVTDANYQGCSQTIRLQSVRDRKSPKYFQWSLEKKQVSGIYVQLSPAEQMIVRLLARLSRS
jgi:hypothetical protein